MSIHQQGYRNGSRSPSRIDATQWRGRVCRFEGSEYVPGPDGNHWRSFDQVPAGASAGYGEFTDDPEGSYFLSDFLSGSDYSGCLVERANYRDFLELFGDRDGVHEVYGGHGTYAIAVHVDVIDGEMAEVFSGLEDYPLMCDETHGEMELEAASEAWESWAESDFTRALESRFSEDGYGELAYVPNPEPAGQGRLFETGERPCPESHEDAVRELFETAREAANCYWEVETGGGVHVDVDRVADAVSANMMRAHGLTVEDEADA